MILWLFRVRLASDEADATTALTDSIVLESNGSVAASGEAEATTALTATGEAEVTVARAPSQDSGLSGSTRRLWISRLLMTGINVFKRLAAAQI
jgi:hypothetical protein